MIKIIFIQMMQQKVILTYLLPYRLFSLLLSLILSFSSFFKLSTHLGITVVFEYYGVGNGGNHGNNNASIAYEGMVEGNAAAGYDLLPPKEGSLLICSYSHLSSAGELQVMSKEDIQHTSTG
jgi:hypothetical protein